MTTLSPGQIYALAISAGLSPVSATTATAVALAESGGRTDAVGDVALEDAKWGPSVGLWQIRSLKAEYGKGTPRDASRLTDPAFNARAMHVISGGGQSFGAWSTFTSGAYKKQLSKLSTADVVAGGMDSIPVVGGVLGGALSAGSNAVSSLTSAWGKDAMTIGLKIAGALAAGALVVVGAVHTVNS